MKKKIKRLRHRAMCVWAVLTAKRMVILIPPKKKSDECCRTMLHDVSPQDAARLMISTLPVLFMADNIITEQQMDKNLDTVNEILKNNGGKI